MDGPAMEIGLRILAGVLMLAVNAFFVSTEFALTRIRQYDREEFAGDGPLADAWEMTDQLEIYLTSCQLGITLSSLLLGIVTEPAVSRLLAPAAALVGLEGRALSVVSVIAAVVLLQLVHAVWGEQVPTYLGVERPKEVVRRTARAHRAWTRLVRPAIALGDALAKWTLRSLGVEMSRSWIQDADAADPDERPVERGELKRHMGRILARGGLPVDRRREVLAAFEIGDVPVREIMVPRERIATLRAGGALDETLAALRGLSHTRLPLRDDGGRYAGILYLPALVSNLQELRAGEIELLDLAVPPVRLDADTPVSRLIDRLQDEEQELALVEEGGEVVGLVTATDAFERIIGDLRDPLDEAT